MLSTMDTAMLLTLPVELEEIIVSHVSPTSQPFISCRLWLWHPVPLRLYYMCCQPTRGCKHLCNIYSMIIMLTYEPSSIGSET